MEKAALFSNGDFRQSIAKICWPKQEETLEKVEQAFKKLRVKTFRANPYKEYSGHGFINTQAEACKIFSSLDANTPVVLVFSSWVWAHHVASSLKLHKGPILLLANFDGTWPGLVSLLNHSATFERMNIAHSRIWTDAFLDDPQFMENLQSWVEKGKIEYSENHITNLQQLRLPQQASDLGEKLAQHILQNKRILGQMDPGCMGMFNAVMSPDKLASIGMPLELLSQSDLLAEMSEVPDKLAEKNLAWLREQGTTFHWGTDTATELTEDQVLEQMKMYTAAGRIYNRYGLSAIGIPYQYGLVRCTSASDLPEGMLNNSRRPDIVDLEAGKVINQGRPIVHFNEGDVGSAVPQVIMYDVLTEKNMPPETTLHDIRWGDWWEDRFIWVFEISGGAPPAHFGGWHKTHVYHQTPQYFPKGGGTCSGVSRPGIITWARFYESFGKIGIDCGTGKVIQLPNDEVNRRLSCTNKEWPIANVHIPGYDRDQLMSTHKSNHITICYGDILAEFAAVCKCLDLPVNVAGEAKKNFS